MASAQDPEPEVRYAMFHTYDGEPADSAADKALSFARYAEEAGNLTRLWRDDYDPADPVWFVKVSAQQGCRLDLSRLEKLADFCDCEDLFTSSEYGDEVREYTWTGKLKP